MAFFICTYRVHCSSARRSVMTDEHACTVFSFAHAAMPKRQRTTVTLLPLVEPCMQHACFAMGPGMICIVAQMYKANPSLLATSSSSGFYIHMHGELVGRSRGNDERVASNWAWPFFSVVSLLTHTHTHGHGSIQPTLVAVTVYFFRKSSKSQFRSSWHMRQFDFDCLPFFFPYMWIPSSHLYHAPFNCSMSYLTF